MKDTRYQFQPWYIRTYRWLRWRPWYYILVSYVLYRWCLNGSKIPPEEEDWFTSRAAYINHILRCYSSLAHMKMEYYWTMDEVLDHCREKLCRTSK
jgi:hypothetical protein